MDKVKSVTKNGWKPGGDRPIHRESWKSDLKGMATGKKKDPYEYARDHQSAPLTTLKDPDSFGPPPKHREFYPDGQSPASANQPARWTANLGAGVGAKVNDGPSGGLGSVVQVRSRQQREQEAAQKIEEEETPKQPTGPFKIDSSGLRTDHLPKPLVRRDGPNGPVAASSPSTPSRAAATAAVPARVNSPSLPPRQNLKPGVPPPVLPPRQNEYPDEHTPAPPPPYSEATPPSSQPGISVNQNALHRLGQAGVSVPGLGIGSQSGTPSPAAAPTAQVNELQQRFAQMNTGVRQQTSHAAQAPALSGNAAVQAASKKGPPPPPPKKSGLVASANDESAHTTAQPPPLPLSSKPRPT
nr:hypothetical protein CFP56_30991 [Quercus suber]